MPWKLATSGANEGDLELSGGTLVWIGHTEDKDDITAMIRQRVTTRLKHFLGEWYQDQSLGVPWRQSLMGGGVTAARAQSIFRRVIIETPGITAVTKCVVTLDGTERVGTLDFEAVTDIGTAIRIADLSAPNRIVTQEVSRGG